MCSLKFTLTGKEQKDAITEKRERERRLGRKQEDLTNTCQNCNACHVVVMTIPEPKCRNCSIIAPGNTLPRENCIKRERDRGGRVLQHHYTVCYAIGIVIGVANVQAVAN